MNKIYWLRGGAVGLGIGLMLSILLTLSHAVAVYLIFLWYPVIIGGLFLNGLLGCPFFKTNWSGQLMGPAYCMYSDWVSVIVVGILFFFILGAIVGWVYGKFKNQK